MITLTIKNGRIITCFSGRSFTVKLKRIGHLRLFIFNEEKNYITIPCTSLRAAIALQAYIEECFAAGCYKIDITSQNL